MEIDYSLIICTYNPDERLLERCLHAVHQLNLDNINSEVIIVDNNSTVPVSGLHCTLKYRSKISNMSILHVARQGVGHARVAAIEKATGKYIVYFDYDNEPEPDYLQQLKQLNEQLPQVAAWGPGNVWVDFIDGISPDIENYGRIAFQEKHETNLTYANVREWQPFYPYGTGLCTTASLLRGYVARAKQGAYTMPGRKGNQLSGGEDTQMVLHCISKGFAAGVSPALKLKHMIPASRANLTYLKRFAYYTGLDYMSCMLQVFPEYDKKIQQLNLPGSKFTRQLIKRYFKSKVYASPVKLLHTIGFIGFNAGIYRALNKPLPGMVSGIVRKLGLE